MCVPRPADCPGGDCGAVSEPAVEETSGLPLIGVDDFEYVGAFTMPPFDYGESSLNRANGPIELSGDSLFIVGNPNQDAIAEFVVPDLVRSTDIASLNNSGPPVQEFARVLDRSATGNPQGIDQITGMEVIDGRLVVNAVRYYDGKADNTHTTLVLDDPANIAGSSVDGFFELPRGAKAAGWISPVPPEWQGALGATHITGFSSATPINARHSIGPSAHALDAADVFRATTGSPAIRTTTLLEFSLKEPLSGDLNNESGTNDLWTYESAAVYGFIVPGTRTYATLGSSGGHDSGIGYKITQDDGNKCAGYCTYEAADNYNHYWLWDLNDLLDVQAGRLAPSAVRPYAYGKFPAPFQEAGRLNRIGGGTFDEASGTLYLSLIDADPTQAGFRRAPVIAAYRFPAVSR